MFFSQANSGGDRGKDSWFRRWMGMCLCSVAVLLLCKHVAVVHEIYQQVRAVAYKPVVNGIQYPFRFVIRQFGRFQHDRLLLENAQSLKLENEELRAQVQLMGHYQAENRRLRMLMDSVGNVTEPVMVAELLDADIEGYRETLMINKGYDDGVYLQQAVIDPFGLVGQVTAVFPHSASVMLITDARSRVPVYVERTHQRAVVSGSLEKEGLIMPNMRVDSDLQVGDQLVSSGLGGIFPRGYPVATVVAVVRDQRHSFLQVKLRPLAQLSSILEVLLLDQRKVPELPELPVGPPLPPTFKRGVL